MKKPWMTTMTAFAAAAVLAASMTGCGAKEPSADMSAQESRVGNGQDGSGQNGTGQNLDGQGQAGGDLGGTEQTGAMPLKGTTITFWHSMGGVNGEALDYLVNRFNTENTFGIQVDAQYQGEYDDAINKLKSAQIGNMWGLIWFRYMTSAPGS